MTRIAILAVAASLLLFLALAQSEDASGAEGEGWFTEEQADRGSEAYADHCARCHAPDLRARATYISLYGYPALTGTFFMDRWQQQSVATLFEVIHQTMPLDAPNSLDADTYADITAHILRTNGFPAGGEELPTMRGDASRLEGLIIEPLAAAQDAAPQEPDVIELRPKQEDGDDAAAEPEKEGAAAEGETLYADHCAQCHGAEGGGGAGPPLAGNDFLQDAQAVVQQILHGGGGMPAFQDTLSSEQIAAVASHVRTSWGNDFGDVGVNVVAAEAPDGAEDAAAEVEEEPAPWYTEEQADRARTVFIDNCARCHGRALQGTGAAPSLAGGNFIARWQEKPLADLYFIASALMPLDDPGALDAETYADLLAYVLQQNGFEAGDDELPADAEALERYVIRSELAEVPDVP